MFYPDTFFCFQINQHIWSLKHKFGKQIVNTGWSGFFLDFQILQSFFHVFPITITLMFFSFYSSLVRSKYLSIFSLSFILTLMIFALSAVAVEYTQCTSAEE